MLGDPTAASCEGDACALPVTSAPAPAEAASVAEAAPAAPASASPADAPR